MIDISSCIPEMKTGKELVDALRILPEYDPDICSRSTSARLIALSDIYKIYVPSEMSVEIYNKLYLALLRSLQKKYTRMATLQQKENFKAIRQQEYDSIIGGSDSFTIIGASGIGKSSAVSRAVSLIAESPVISLSVPHTKIIPCITVQCPWDSSVKGLLLEILRKVDELLGSKYYSNAIRARATTDMLIGSVSQVALNHIGLLIVDEIQNICTGRNGKGLVGMLTQLINNSGISIAMVGTPESTVFFQKEQQLARRSLGLTYTSLPYDRHFEMLCRTLFCYQYTTHLCPFTEGLTEWLYEHSGGIVSTVVSMVHDAQEIAITRGDEMIGIELLNMAFVKRMGMLHNYLEANPKRESPKAEPLNADIPADVGKPIDKPVETDVIADAIQCSQNDGTDIVEQLRKLFPVHEVAL